MNKQELIAQQLEFLKSQSVISKSVIEGNWWYATFQIIDRQWVVEVVEG
jgi:hypothetical protein